MSFVAGAFILAAMLMLLFPNTPFAQRLHFHLVENPMDVLSKLERKHFIYLLIGIVCFQSYVAVMPLEIATALAWDMTLYIDAVISIRAITTLAKVNAAWFSCKQKIAIWYMRMTGRRIRQRKRRSTDKVSGSKSANDNDGHGQWLIAA